jgi:hypothetical protein
MVHLQQYCYHSARKLEAAGRFQNFIRPVHCCIGSIDHTLVDTVYQALREWTERTGRSVEFVMKGQNRWT